MHLPVIRLYLVAGAVAGALLASIANAADADDPNSAERIVVTASREPEKAGDALVPVIVIDRDAIEQSLATDVAELLRFHAGIDVVPAGGPGQQTSVFIRGANSNQTVVLIDGVRINPGTVGTPALQNIAPELVDHIEVVKGPMSTLYGSDAIGGVINVITRHDGNDLEAMLGYGRYDTRAGYAGGQYSGPDGSVSLAVNYLDSSGFPPLTGSTLDSPFRDTSENVGAHTTVGGVELGARAWHASGTTDYLNDIVTPLDQNYDTSSYAVYAAGSVTADWHSKLTLSRATDDIRQVQPDPYAFPVADDFATTNRNTIDWQNDVRAGAQLFTFGGIVSAEHARTLSYGDGYDVETYSDTWFAQDKLDFGNEQLQAAVGWTHHSVFGDHYTWNAEYGIEPAKGTRLTVGWGTAFRAPNSTDLYGYGGNPELKPESSRNLELGLRQQISAHQWLTLAAFDNRIDDLIVFVDNFVPPVYGQSENVDRARIRGIEAGWEWDSPDWRARIEGSLQNPEDLSDGTELLRRAKESATLALVRKAGSSEYSADVLLSGPRMDTDFESTPPYADLPVRLGGYALVNLAARWALSPSFSLQARLENALDRRYTLAYGYNTMARSLMVSVRYKYH
jgi:vitamin B12 transporter